MVSGVSASILLGQTGTSVPACTSIGADRMHGGLTAAAQAQNAPLRIDRGDGELKTILIKDRFSGAPVLQEMLSAIAGLELAATLAGADLAISWLASHTLGWTLAVVVVEQDAAQMDVIAFARAANPAAKIVVTGSIVCGEVRSECLRCGADAAFDGRRIGDLAAWLDQLSAGGT